MESVEGTKRVPSSNKTAWVGSRWFSSGWPVDEDDPSRFGGCIESSRLLVPSVPSGTQSRAHANEQIAIGSATRRLRMNRVRTSESCIEYMEHLPNSNLDRACCIFCLTRDCEASSAVLFDMLWQHCPCFFCATCSCLHCRCR